jgi:peptidoglycan/xylan/chitin deacetylase (PgdA/CDA1 family)
LLPILVGAAGHVDAQPRESTLPQGLAELEATRPITRCPEVLSAIALTFDDGPDPRYTPHVLDTLAEHDAKATFFVTGEAAEEHEWLVARMLAEGHEVAHHTHSHMHVESLDRAATEEDMDECLAVLESLGVEPRWYRPPRKENTWMQVELAADRGMSVALWARTLERKRFSSADEVTRVLLAETQPGEIILAHDGRVDRSMTVEALPGYLQGLGDRGVDVVTLSQLSELAETR